MDSLFIVMPAYNEEDNIEGVVRQWYRLLDGKGDASRLVIADSGSSDCTHEILVGLQKEFKQLDILSVERRFLGLSGDDLLSSVQVA